MHDSSDNPRANSDPAPPRSQHAKVRKHYFHFATGHRESPQALLVIAGKALEVTVPEETQYGFSAIGTAKVAEGLRLGARWVLILEEKRFEVFPQWIYCAADGRVQIGLRRMQQLTSVSEMGVICRLRSQFKPNGQWALVMAILVMVLSSAWLMRQIYHPPDQNTRGHVVRLENLSKPHD